MKNKRGWKYFVAISALALISNLTTLLTGVEAFGDVTGPSYLVAFMTACGVGLSGFVATYREVPK